MGIAAFEKRLTAVAAIERELARLRGARIGLGCHRSSDSAGRLMRAWKADVARPGLGGRVSQICKNGTIDTAMPPGEPV
jgi:hypothetical protein